jgi:hypothetical protein
MLVRSGEFSDSARLLATLSACNESLGMLWCAAYGEPPLIEVEKGKDVLGLVSIGAEGNPKGDPSWVETGDKVSVADWGGVNVNPPKAGLMPVGEM